MKQNTSPTQLDFSRWSVDLLAQRAPADPALTTAVSLVVISRDDPKLFSCVESIQALEQVEHIELVVLLDGSPLPYTASVAQVLSDGSIPLVLARTHSVQSIGQMRNWGAALASSRYLVFVDSDCVLPTDYGLRLVPVLGTAPFITGKVVFQTNKNTWFSRHNCLHRQIGYDSRRDMIRTPNLVVAKEAFEAVGGFEDTSFGDDFLFHQNCHLAGYRTRYVDELVLYHSDDEQWQKTVRTWFKYGMGATYRYKRLRWVGLHPSLLGVFRHRRLCSLHPSWAHRLFHSLYVAVFNAGALYGFWHWRSDPKTFLAQQ